MGEEEVGHLHSDLLGGVGYPAGGPGSSGTSSTSPGAMSSSGLSLNDFCKMVLLKVKLKGLASYVCLEQPSAGSW